MIKITKDPEPQEWRDYRNTPGVVYAARSELRNSLLSEQGYICAYCMQRIPVQHGNEAERSRIEHVLSREDRPDLQLVYNNMVVCCPGNYDNVPHCDRSKGSFSVTFSLLTDQLPNSISYRSKGGEILSSNADWSLELNDRLHLNHARLKSNRKQALEAVIATLGSQNWRNNDIRRELDLWIERDRNGYKRPYCGIVIWFLERKLRQSV